MRARHHKNIDNDNDDDEEELFMPNGDMFRYYILQSLINLVNKGY